MTEPGAPTTYAAVAAGGITLWAVPLQTWLGYAVAVLTIAVLVVRLCLDGHRVWTKWKEK